MMPARTMSPHLDRRSRVVVLPTLSSTSQAHLRWRVPHPRLEPFVVGHWVRSANFQPSEPTAQFLRFPCVNLLGDADSISVQGLQLTRFSLPGSDRSVVYGTNLRPGAFAAFTAYPRPLLNDRRVPLQVVFGTAGWRVSNELTAAAGREDEDRYFDQLERFLLSREPRVDARYALVREVESAMLDGSGGESVGGLAQQSGVSLSTLQRAFVSCVGVTPKWMLRRYRLQRAVERLSTAALIDMASLAVDLGYCDQAHFTRDFREEVGMPPGEYLRACRARGESHQREGDRSLSTWDRCLPAQ